MANHSSHIPLQALTPGKENHITQFSQNTAAGSVVYGPLKGRHIKMHIMSEITAYDVTVPFNTAYKQVANISEASLKHIRIDI